MTELEAGTMEVMELGGPVLPGHELLCEMLSVITSGTNVDLYLEGRNCGISHEELIWVLRKPFGMRVYIDARQAGVTHDELVQLSELGAVLTTLQSYLLGRQEGLGHDDLCGGLGSDSLGGYVSLRRSGASHEEALDASDARVEIAGYCAGRRAGVTHDEILEAAGESGWGLEIYIDERVRGASHSDALEMLYEHGGRYGGRGTRRTGLVA
jgi:hypothetical protein